MSVDPVPIKVTAELPAHIPSDAGEHIRRAVTDLAESLEIPVEPVLEIVPGNGRLVIADQAIRLDVGNEVSHGSYGLHRTWRLAAALITPRVARRLIAASAAGEHGLRELRSLLVRGVSLGFRLSRFRSAAVELAQGAGARSMLELFEECIAGEECCVARVALPPSSEGIHGLSRNLADELFEHHGLLIPLNSVQIDKGLQPNECRVEWNDLRLRPLVTIREDQIFVEAEQLDLKSHAISAERFTDSISGLQGSLTKAENKERCDALQLVSWTARELLLRNARLALPHSGASLVNRATTEFYLLRLRDAYPVLTETLRRRFDIDFLTNVLRELSAEGVSLRQCVAIFDSLLELNEVATADSRENIIFSPLGVLTKKDPAAWNSGEALVEKYVNYARVALKRYITGRHSRDHNMIAHLLDNQWEETFLRRQPLLKRDRRRFLASVAAALEPNAAAATVILTFDEIRRAVANELKTEFPLAQVLSFQELSPEVNITTSKRIRA